MMLKDEIESNGTLERRLNELMIDRDMERRKAESVIADLRSKVDQLSSDVARLSAENERLSSQVCEMKNSADVYTNHLSERKKLFQ